jgi:hypothetical protein
MLLDRARLARMVAHIDEPAFTRADLVELVGALLPVDAPADPRALIEQIVDMVGVRVSATRDAHHREGHELFTVDAVIAEEARIFDMVGALPTLRAASDPGVLGGQYFGPDGFAQIQGYPTAVASSDRSHDVDLQRRL